jgi:hypothetical protein
MTIYPSTNTHAAKRLGKLAKLYESGQVSETTARTLGKLLEYEAGQARTQLSEIEKDLGALEKANGMTTARFIRKYEGGKTDDRAEFVEWISLAQMAENLRHRLKLLDEKKV